MTHVKHPYYLKSKKEQNLIQLKIAAIALVVNLLIILISIFTGFYLIAILFIAITLAVIAPFFDTPSLAKSGRLIYYSPLFLAEKERNGIITIHGGTLFDYVFVIDRSLSGKQRTLLILQTYLDGLINLIEKYQGKSTDEIKVRGTSYVLNERTASKIGLKKTQTSSVQMIILILNYIRLTFEHSFAKAKISFPNLRNINTYEGDLSDLIEQKEYLIKLRNSLQ